MKIFVFGAGGVIGQHMMLQVPHGVDAHFFRREPDRLFRGIDLTDLDLAEELLREEKPDAIVNLAGESNVDAVEKRGAFKINVQAMSTLANWSDLNGGHYIHVSTQAVFDGKKPPYNAKSEKKPVNLYGFEKAAAEDTVIATYRNFTIVRPTFVIGIRPIPSAGRRNPAEAILAGEQPHQVEDLWFSPLFAEDAAASLWAIATKGSPQGNIVHLGHPVRKSRLQIAKDLGVKALPCNHSEFPGLAPRAKDTTYANPLHQLPYANGIANVKRAFESMETVGFYQRARELALFFKIPFEVALAKLGQGFGPLHNAVTDDFKCVNPKGDEELLAWYRATDAYCWELSAYHCDEGFNYTGMCKGIGETLETKGVKTVLCLGDGIGDLTMSLRKRAMQAVYHDLAHSVTAQFAAHRFWMYGAEGMNCFTSGWSPDLMGNTEFFDAIVSLDFLEHVTDVPAWVKAIYAALRPGGFFVAQNAFAMGSGPDGAMPMHLSVNDRFEKDWDPLLTEVGFTQETSNWYVKP